MSDKKSSKRGQSTRLEVTPGLLASRDDADAVAVTVRSAHSKKGGTEDRPSGQMRHLAPTQEIGEIPQLSGKVKLRRESKGRGGRTVTILFAFSDEKARIAACLNALCTTLKTKLACGGSCDTQADDGTPLLLLQTDNIERVTQELTKLGIEAKRAGA